MLEAKHDSPYSMLSLKLFYSFYVSFSLTNMVDKEQVQVLDHTSPSFVFLCSLYLTEFCGPLILLIAIIFFSFTILKFFFFLKRACCARQLTLMRDIPFWVLCPQTSHAATQLLSPTCQSVLKLSPNANHFFTLKATKQF